MTNEPNVVSTLHREATAAKGVGDMARAVSCLKRAKALMGEGYPIDTWLRLPVFMQQANLFDDAMDEFAWLIERVNAGDLRFVPHGGPYFVRNAKAVALTHIYDKMRLVCQRVKKHEQAKELLALKEKQQDLREMLEPLVRKEWNLARRKT